MCREPFSLISSEWTTFSEISRNMISAAIGIVEPSKFLDALVRVHHRGQPVRMAQLMHTFAIEIWLRSLRETRPARQRSRGIRGLSRDLARNSDRRYTNSNRKEVNTNEIRET